MLFSKMHVVLFYYKRQLCIFYRWQANSWQIYSTIFNW